MFVWRLERLVKKDKTKEVAERLVEAAKKMAPHAWRVYTQGIGPRDTVVMELEFETLAEFEPHFNHHLTGSFGPQDTPDVKWWADAGVPGGVDEVWYLMASSE
jgi:hypothetical protein